jgi:hypothetical protein
MSTKPDPIAAKAKAERAAKDRKQLSAVLAELLAKPPKQAGAWTYGKSVAFKDNYVKARKALDSGRATAADLSQHIAQMRMYHS